MLLSVVGFFISMYAYYIEIMMVKSLTFRPFCDFSDTVTCSEVILSEYGRLFRIPNSILGMLFYSAVMFLFNANYLFALFILCILAGMVTLFLFSVLIFRIKKLCILCYSVYIINFVLIVLVYFKNY